MIIFINRINTSSIFIIIASLIFNLLFEEHITSFFIIFWMFNPNCISNLQKQQYFLIISRNNAELQE